MTSTTTEYKFKPGDTVRMSEQLEASWIEGRIAGGSATGQLIGQISDKPAVNDFCGTCEYAGAACPGPFYVVVNIDASGIFGDGSVYADHELRAADIAQYLIETGEAIPFRLGQP